MQPMLIARSPIANPLLWLDLETTGLDPKGCRVISLGYILTDGLLNEIARDEFVFYTGEHHLGRMIPLVYDMHTASGLLGRVRTSDVWFEDGIQALADKLDVLLAPENPATLAGSSVQFDRSFLYEYAPRFVDKLSHRQLDVSTLKVMAKCFGLPEFKRTKDKQHTPLADLAATLDEFRHYRWTMLGQNAVPASLIERDSAFYRAQKSEG